MTNQAPIAVDLDRFLTLPIEDKPPLLGIDGQSAIVAGGLVLLGGQAGLGKTTLIVDAIFHLASGMDWLTFTVSRPLNILVIENEGPLRMFQQKLAAKRKVWQHDLQGQIHIQTDAWGWFSFADLDHHTRIKAYLEQNQIDLVIGDPIGTLGMEGVGSPEDTRTFVRLLVPLGLFDNRAFWFPVHFTKEPRKDEINQISGAWGGHLDTLMVLKATRRKDELRLSFPKLRWWNTNPPAPMILGKVYNTQTFELLRHEGDQEPLEERIIERLSQGDWLTAAEIANKTTGIEGGARVLDIRKALEARTDLFRWEGGADHNRSAKAIVWSLVPTPGTSRTHKTAQPSQETLVPGLWDDSDESDESLSDKMSQLLVPAQRDESDESKNQARPDMAEDSSHNPPYRGVGTSTQSDPPPTRPSLQDECDQTEANGNGNGSRWHDAEQLVRDGLWMLEPDQVLEALIELDPMIPTNVLDRLRQLAAQLAADEAGGPGLPT